MILSHGLATARTFSFAFTGNASDVNLRVAALAAGWNGADKVLATINSGVVLFSSATNKAGLTVDGSFPRGIELIVVSGLAICGRGGEGGPFTDGHSFANGGSPGGPGLLVSVPITITNIGQIAGGGGGGGGGGGATGPDDAPLRSGTGGSGASFGVSATAGTVGGTSYGGTYAGSGGSGGALGTVGSPGSGSYSWAFGNPTSIPGGDPGAAGNAVIGNSFITWLATGTRTGPVV